MIDKTCTVCKGKGCLGGSMVPGHPEPADASHARDGTGVDETMPLRMIGIGSVLRTTLDLAAPVDVVLLTDNHGGTYARSGGGVIDADEIGPDKTWQVVCAVPPMHKEADDE
jgi:hypothetical protein